MDFRLLTTPETKIQRNKCFIFAILAQYKYIWGKYTYGKLWIWLDFHMIKNSLHHRFGFIQSPYTSSKTRLHGSKKVFVGSSDE